MSFIIPDDVKRGKVGGPDLAKGTLSLYKTCVNKIAMVGYETREHLRENPQAVIDTLNEWFPTDDEKARANKRKFYSAIFWILSDNPALESKQMYYDEFQKVKHNYQNPLAGAGFSFVS